VPETAFATLTSPARMILLTEQTHDFERGRSDRVYSTLRRYMLGAAAVTALLLPPLALFMPNLLRIAYGANATPATGAARVFLLVAAIQVILGWAKSFPVSIGRPALRLLAQGTEIIVLVPALLLLGAAHGATGAAGGFLLAAIAFAGVWVLLMLRMRAEHRAGPEPGGPSRPDAIVPDAP
jgi:O-antigen/teichoic acid export membrane protein